MYGNDYLWSTRVVISTSLLLLSFWTLSIVRISTNRKRNVSETGSVSVFRQGRGGTYSTEKPKACLSTGDARAKEGQPLETKGLLTPDRRKSPWDVTRRYEVKNLGAERKEKNNNENGGNNY
jgi:hypothetical protein